MKSIWEIEKIKNDQINEKRERERYKKSMIEKEAKFSFDSVVACANSIREKRGSLLDMMDSKTEKNDIAFDLEHLLTTIELHAQDLKDDARWEAYADVWVEKYRQYMQDGDAV